MRNSSIISISITYEGQKKKRRIRFCPHRFYRSITTQHCFCRFAEMLDIFPITFIVWLCWRCSTFALLLVLELYTVCLLVFCFILIEANEGHILFFTWGMCRELSEEEKKRLNCFSMSVWQRWYFYVKFTFHPTQQWNLFTPYALPSDAMPMLNGRVCLPKHLNRTHPYFSILNMNI